ncbi:MAG: hypothetical protein P8080_09645 [Gammaproteobacteria bacterium]
MSGLGCCFWWFVFGLLLGWLASWLIGRMIGKGTTESEPLPVAAPPPPEPKPRQKVDYAAAEAAGFRVTGDDNLEIIEGIGPKIAHLLRTNGVESFDTLAGMQASAVQEILTRAGWHYDLARPDTWSEQAALAAANRWEDLHKLQEELIGGVRR